MGCTSSKNFKVDTIDDDRKAASKRALLMNKLSTTSVTLEYFSSEFKDMWHQAETAIFIHELAEIQTKSPVRYRANFEGKELFDCYALCFTARRINKLDSYWSFVAKGKMNLPLNFSGDIMKTIFSYLSLDAQFETFVVLCLVILQEAYTYKDIIFKPRFNMQGLYEEAQDMPQSEWEEFLKADPSRLLDLYVL